ncbi:MAG: hypothetical protein OXB84_01220, partial [Halobacteriovoraceae bacterium]|nr:hypothetical protein [Halobacteriovoraceae bacterium]
MNQFIKKLFFSILLICDFTYAAINDVMGPGARNKSMAQAGGPTDAGAFSAKTNPAALGKIKKNRFSAGYGFHGMNLASQEQMDDFPREGFLENSSGIIPAESDFSVDSDFRGLEFGTAFSLGRRLSLGIVALLPADSFLKIHAFTRNDITHLHFNEKQQRPEVYTAFGYELFSFFSLGAGVFYSLKANGDIQMGLSDQIAEARLLLDVAPAFIPFAGIHLEKSMGKGKLLAGAVYRREQSADTKLN